MVGDGLDAERWIGRSAGDVRINSRRLQVRRHYHIYFSIERRSARSIL